MYLVKCLQSILEPLSFSIYDRSNSTVHRIDDTVYNARRKREKCFYHAVLKLRKTFLNYISFDSLLI